MGKPNRTSSSNEMARVNSEYLAFYHVPTDAVLLVGVHTLVAQLSYPYLMAEFEPSTFSFYRKEDCVELGVL